LGWFFCVFHACVRVNYDGRGRIVVCSANALLGWRKNSRSGGRFNILSKNSIAVVSVALRAISRHAGRELVCLRIQKVSRHRGAVDKTRRLPNNVASFSESQALWRQVRMKKESG
jgi:hypothetical protein